MKPILLALVCVPFAACSIFDLDEIKNAPHPDAAQPVADSGPGAPDGEPPPPPPDAAPGVPDAMDDPNIPPGATLGSCDPTRWVVSASDSHPVNPPSHAIDGLLPTRWSTGAAQAPGEYFQIDFGGYVMLDQVAMNPAFGTDGHGDHPRSVDVLVSDDGVDFSWRIADHLFGDADPGIATVTFPMHAARYLRLKLTASSGSWWSIHELTLGCTVPGATPSPDAGPLNDGPDGGLIADRAAWTAVGTPSANGSLASDAFDGNAGSRWADGKTPQYGDEIFRLDLGSVQDVSGVQMSSVSGDYPAAVAVDLSSDDVSYTEAAHALGGDVTTINFHRQPARYVKIRQIGSGYDHWWGINEINVVK